MWNVSSPWTVAGSSVRLPAASERMGRPAASVKETAPELRSDDDVQFGGGEDEGRRAHGELPAGGEGGIGKNVERGAGEEIGGAREGHADDAVGEELDAEIAGVEVEGEAVGLAVHLRRRCGNGWRRRGCMKSESGEAERGGKNCGLCCGSELHEESLRCTPTHSAKNAEWMGHPAPGFAQYNCVQV